MTIYALTRDQENAISAEKQLDAIQAAGFSIDKQNLFVLDNNLTRQGRKNWQNNFFTKLQANDELICFNLAAFGGTLGSIITKVNILLKKGITLQFIKIGVYISSDKNNEIWRILAQTEEELISERTAKSKKQINLSDSDPGRPQGKLSKSMLDPYKNKIRKLLKNNMSIGKIAKEYNCSEPTVHNFIKTRGLKK